MRECACCGEVLNSDGDCPNDCTEDSGYSFAEGYSWDDEDIRRESISRGECLNCGEKIPAEETRCPNGCLDE